MSDGITIGQLTLELTRRCNMKCGHCLRGSASSIDMEVRQVMFALYEAGVTQIDSVTFTGGEPSMVPDLIRQFREEIHWCKIDLGYWYVVTNAKEYVEEFALQLGRLTWYTDLPGECNLDISNDQWHRHEGQQQHVKFQYEEFFQHGTETEDEYDIHAGEGACEAMVTQRRELKWDKLLDQGRSRTNQFGANGKPDREEVKFNEHGDIEQMYINAHGDIIPGGDWSYVMQPKIRLGNILKNGLKEIVPGWNEASLAEEARQVKEAELCELC